MRQTNSDGWSKVLNDQYVITAPYIHPEYFISGKNDEPGGRGGIDRGELRTGLGQRGIPMRLGWVGLVGRLTSRKTLELLDLSSWGRCTHSMELVVS